MNDQQQVNSQTIFQRLRAQRSIKSASLSLHQLQLGTPYKGHPENQHVLVVAMPPQEQFTEVPLDQPRFGEMTGHFDVRVDLDVNSGNVIHKSGMWAELVGTDALSFVLDIRFTGVLNTEHPFMAWEFTIRASSLRIELSGQADKSLVLPGDLLESLKAIRLLNYTLRTTWSQPIQDLPGGVEERSEDVIINHG